MRIMAVGALLLSTLISSSALAGKIFSMGEVGYSRLSIDQPPEYAYDKDGDEAGGSVNFLVGYKFDSNVLVGVNAGFTESDGILGLGFDDFYSVGEYGLFMGYAVNVAPHFRIVPAVGINRWEFESSSGVISDWATPGDPEEVYMRGTDPYWRVNLEFPITSLVQLNLAYQESDYDIGKLWATRFGVKFEF